MWCSGRHCWGAVMYPNDTVRRRMQVAGAMQGSAIACFQGRWIELAIVLPRGRRRFIAASAHTSCAWCQTLPFSSLCTNQITRRLKRVVQEICRAKSRRQRSRALYELKQTKHLLFSQNLAPRPT